MLGQRAARGRAETCGNLRLRTGYYVNVGGSDMKYLIIAGVLLMLASPVRAQDGMERYQRESERLLQQQLR